MSYYDVDAILTDAQKLPCTFEMGITGLGFLESSGTPDIKPNTTISLPIWLSSMLAVSQRLGTQTPLLTLDLPPSLSPPVLAALKADPKSVDLRSLAPYFYGLGVRMLELVEDDELVEVLLKTYKERAGLIGDFAGGRRGERADEFLRGLEEWERRVFRAAEGGGRGVREWMGERSK